MVRKEYVEKNHFEHDSIGVREYLEKNVPITHEGINPIFTSAHYKNCEVRMTREFNYGSGNNTTDLWVSPNGGGNAKEVFAELEKILLRKNDLKK